MCGSMADIQSAAAEIRRGKKKKKKEERRTNHSMKIYMVSLFHRATINNRQMTTCSTFGSVFILLRDAHQNNAGLFDSSDR